MDLNEIKELIALMDASLLSEIEVEDTDHRICLKRTLGVALAPSDSGIPVSAAGPPQQHSPEKQASDSAYHHVTSPIVGTFYKSASPEANPYIEIGGQVKKGQVICIVEAMKLMNEIESDVDGRVVKICVEDGAAVEYGEFLVAIDPS